MTKMGRVLMRSARFWWVFIVIVPTAAGGAAPLSRRGLPAGELWQSASSAGGAAQTGDARESAPGASPATPERDSASGGGAGGAAPPRGSVRHQQASAPSAASGDRMGLDAPLLVVDRFSDRAGTRLRRSSRPGLPGPGQPIDLDSPQFLRTVQGPNGAQRFCYDLDLRAAEPGRFYVFYDTLMQYVLTQLPVVDRVPGNPQYTDLWQIWRVTIPNGGPRDNRIRDVETLERLLADPSSGYTAEKTGHLLDAPIVPDGSHASMKADNRSGPAALLYAWYRGKRAPYLYFEQNLISDGLAPVSEMTLAGSRDPAEQSSDGARAFAAPGPGPGPAAPARMVTTATAQPGGTAAGLPHGTAAGLPHGTAAGTETVSRSDTQPRADNGVTRPPKSERPTVRALPGQDGYSPLMRLVDAEGRSLYPRPLNCPVVGAESR